MVILTGTPVCGGIVSGKLRIYKRKYRKVKKYAIAEVEPEIRRFDEAKEESLVQLDNIYHEAANKIGEKNAIIFYIHQMMLRDEEFAESVKNIIKSNKINAEAAVDKACFEISSKFLALEDDYMRERAADIKDISERVISNLTKNNLKIHNFCEPVIIAADDFTPSDIINFDRNRVVAFLTENGATMSHTSILAKIMKIPSVISVKGILNPNFDGKNIVINGESGKIMIEADTKSPEVVS